MIRINYVSFPKKAEKTEAVYSQVKLMMKIFKFLFSPVFMGVLLIIFAVSMAAATFIENDFGSPAAYKSVYDTSWFELILLLLAVNLIGQMITFKLFRRSKLTVSLFHLSFVVMITGAAITRYFGWEGSIHIREGEEKDICYSSDRYLAFSLKDEAGNIINQNQEKFVMGAGHYRKKMVINGKWHELKLSKIIPNAVEVVNDSRNGESIVSMIAGYNETKESIHLKKGDTTIMDGISIGFYPETETDLKITSDSVAFYIQGKIPFALMNMMTQEKTAVDNGKVAELKEMQIITAGNIRLVTQKLTRSGTLNPVSADKQIQATGKNVLFFDLLSEGKSVATVNLWDTGKEIRSSGTAEIAGKSLEITYGPLEKKLNFSLRLNDFILERYPGSNSPSGYKSDVVLYDRPAGVEKPFIIFMNNILKYKGFRFYQSSYDPDEKGTILSVNHDPVGMNVTYTGYSLLFIFIILSLLNNKSVFKSINAGYWSSSLRKKVPFILFFIVFTGFVNINAQKLIPDKRSAEEFGQILVQDQKGRTKPLFTLSNDILRKVARENSLDGLTPMQVFLGVYLDFEKWKDVPLIRISNRELQRKLGISGNMAAFSDIVDISRGIYKLSDDVNRVYSLPPGERNKYDKEIIKADERINIVYMIYTGRFLKIFPRKDGQHDWEFPENALKTAVNKEDSLYLENVIPMFADAIRSKNRSAASTISQSIIDYQKKFARYDLPPESKSRAEIIYYKLMIFERLFPFYAAIGLVMLIGLLVMVIRGIKTKSFFVKVLGWLLFAGFLLHTLGLGLRWYISGHSPMSNGYESMIFISWVTLLAGFIFSRKSAFALSATAVLASMTLMVAHLSFMDPEITNLVPVLKSYWLTLHVSVITGSYGFLGLGAILGLISMILISLSSIKNRERISVTIDELVVINYRTLTLGLYLLTIGTFLGAVWANESWGRYWGWDPKETWSLITIIVYTFITHSKNIPGLKDIFSFNLLSLFGFSSVLMTYFGVNYYLSGLHSYAGGDSVPIPGFVYFTVLILVSLTFLAYSRYRKWEKQT